MNYFEFFGLRPAYSIHKSDLRQAYYSNSRLYHPDHEAGRDNDEKDREFLSAFNNQAYQTLLDSTSRLQYILETEFDPGEACEVSLQQEFLVEMMELHERLNEALSTENQEAVNQCIQEITLLENEAEIQTEKFIQAFDQGERTVEVHKGLKAFYFKLKYFKRYRDQIDGIDPVL